MKVVLLLHSVSFKVQRRAVRLPDREVGAGRAARRANVRRRAAQRRQRRAAPAAARDLRREGHGAGLASARPIALSRDQELELTVVSYLDVAVVGGTLAIVAVLLVLAGRPALRRRALRLGRRARAPGGSAS